MKVDKDLKDFYKSLKRDGSEFFRETIRATKEYKQFILERQDKTLFDDLEI